MGWTYAALGAAIQDAANNTEDSFTLNIPVFIQTAEDKLFHELEMAHERATHTTATVASNRYYTMPTDLVSVAEFAIVSGAGVYSYLLNKDTSWMREAYASPATTGVPLYYSWFDETQFLLAPTPNANLTVELNYYRKPVSLVTDTSGTWLSETFDALFFYACMVEAMGFMQNDDDIVKYYQAQYMAALVNAKKVTDRMEITDDYRAGLPVS